MLCMGYTDTESLHPIPVPVSTKGVIRVAPGDRGPGAGPVAPVPAGPPVVAGPLHLTDDVHVGENVGPEDVD